MSKILPRYFQNISKSDYEKLALCLIRCITPVSAKEMLDNIEDVSYKQLKRRYLQPLLDMELISMTMPSRTTSKNQRYILTEKGKDILQSVNR